MPQRFPVWCPVPSPVPVVGYRIFVWERCVMAEDCKINMMSKVLPLAGSVTGLEGKETGTCPECLTPGVMLSVVGGYVRKHVIASVAVPENNPQAPTLAPGKGKKVGKGLSESQTSMTDTGVRVGDPRMAERRRVAEVESVTGTGTVKVPRKVEGKGTLKSGAPRMVTKLVEVEATEAHVREALTYWQGKRIKLNEDGTPASPGARRHKLDMIDEMFRRLKAMSAEAPVMIVEGQVKDTAAAHRGPTLVRGRAMEADTLTERAIKAVAEGRGKPVRPSCDGPLGRERADKRIITVPEPPRRRTKSETRRYRRMLAAGAGRRG